MPLAFGARTAGWDFKAPIVRHDLSGHTMLLAVLSVSALKNEIILCKWKITSANGLAFTDGLGSSEQELGTRSLLLPRRSSGKAWPPLDQVGKCCWAAG